VVNLLEKLNRHCLLAASAMKHSFAFILVASLLSALSSGASVQTSSGGGFELRGHANSGGISSGGQFHLLGGISETAAGVSTSPNFALTGGFIEQFTMSLPLGDIFLDIAVTSTGLEISWPTEALGSTLEATTVLGPAASWQTIPGSGQQTSVTVPSNQQTRFFRLRGR